MRRDLKRIAPFLALALLVALALMLRANGGIRRQPAPEFAAVVRAGEGRGDRVELASLRGRVVVLDFWAHWCQPCRASTPLLNQLQARFSDAPVSVYGVNVETNLSARRVIEEHGRLGAAFPSFHDEDGAIKAAYRVSSLPTIVVVDREGVVRSFESGVPNEAALVRLVESLL